MANFFDVLRDTLGQQARQTNVPSGNPLVNPYSDTSQLPTEEVIPDGDIVVTGGRTEPNPIDPTKYLMEGPPRLDNTEWAQEALAAKQQNDKQVQHKGMFGVKGTLRDVLGVLGDAFLVQSGNKPMYAPQRQAERIGDSMAGITASPRAAVERMTAVDPAFAQGLAKDVNSAETARMVAEAAAAKEVAVRQKQGMNLLGGMMAAKGLDQPEVYSRYRTAMEAIRQSHNLPEEFSPPETYDPNWAATLQSGSIEPDKQMDNDRAEIKDQATIRQGDERVSVSRQRAAESARHNRVNEEIARARAARSGKSSKSNPTAASIAEPLLMKIKNGGSLSASEQEVLDRTGFSPDRGRGGSGRSSRAASSDRSSRFKILN